MSRYDRRFPFGSLALGLGIVAIIVLAVFAVVSGTPHSTANLPSYNGEGNTVVLTPGQTLALEYQEGKTPTYWLVTFDGTTVHIDETGGIGNSHYQGDITGSTESNKTNIQISGWTALDTSFYAWPDPDQSGAAVVLWPSGWDKQ